MKRSLLHNRSSLLLALAAAAWSAPLCAVSKKVATGAGKFASAAFQPQSGTTAPVLYIAGDATAGDDNYALSSVVVDRSGAAPTLTVTALAPDATVSVNGGAVADSPFKAQNITNLAMAGTSPVVTLDADTTVYMVTKPSDGTTVLKNVNALNDASKNASGPIAGMTAGVDADGKPLVFAAVAQTGGAWNALADTDRGIAFLKPTDALDALVPYDATDFTQTLANNKAQKLALTAAAGVVAKDQDGSIDGGPDEAPLHWNKDLQRLYIGLRGIARANKAANGTVSAIAMGKIDDALKGPLSVNPIIAGFPAASFANNGVKGIFGFKGLAAHNHNAFASIRKINSMRTSTEKDYLVVSGNVNDDNGNNIHGVYALPLLPSTHVQAGTISKVVGGIADFANAPAAAADMPTTDHNATKIQHAIADSANVADIFVQGDTVYTCFNGDNDSQIQGLFANTALFNQDGAIRGWTPKRRAFGAVQQVRGGGFDATRGEAYVLTNQADNEKLALKDANTVRVTQWGKSSEVYAAANSRLTPLLETLFPQSEGGVVSYNVFDQNTPGFTAGRLAMGVAVGVNKIAVIRLGVAANANAFVPAKNFVAGADYFVFDKTTAAGVALADIAPLTCAEIARSATADFGWLFVGGVNGVAVLRLANGNGFDSNATIADLTAAAYPGHANWTFKQLTPENNEAALSNVLKLTARNDRMYVTTLGGIFYFDMATNKFADAPGAALGDVKVALPAGTPDNTVYADLVIVGEDNTAGTVANNRGIIATDQGVFVSQLTNVAADSAKADVEVGDLALQLFALGDAANGIHTNANIMALATDFSTNNDKVYGFDVPDRNKTAVQIAGNIKDSFTEQYVLQETKQAIAHDGSALYTTLPKSYGDTRFAAVHQRNANGDSVDLTPALNVDTTKNAWVGRMVMDTASGMMVVPGDFGVRVNE